MDIQDNDQVKLDFKPLYQCLHIYDELGQRTEFRANYSEDRRAQAKLTLSSMTSSFNLKDRNTDNFESLLQDIVGFFIVEHIILYSTVNFRTQAQVHGRTQTKTTHWRVSLHINDQDLMLIFIRY